MSMTENEWTKSISNLLNKELNDKELYVDVLKKIPYSQEILNYDEKWNPNYMEPTRFETDLIIYEKKNDKFIPRVIIESKLSSVSTHDAITYSTKAEKHKNITPFLRYGIMLGDREEYPLPGRLFRHGTNFDFMFSFSGVKPSVEEWTAYTDMILREVEYSRIMEEMLHESRNKDRKRYFMLQRQLVLKELEKEEFS